MIIVGLEDVKRWQDGIENTFSINCITKPSYADGNDYEDIASKGTEANNEVQRPERKEESEEKYDVEIV